MNPDGVGAWCLSQDALSTAETALANGSDQCGSVAVWQSGSVAVWRSGQSNMGLEPGSTSDFL